MNKKQPSQHLKDEKKLPGHDDQRSLRQIITTYFTSTPDGPGNENSQKPIPKFETRVALLQFLKPVPWILLCGFLFSFYWDFNNISAELFGLLLQFDGLLKIITISGLIGFLTNWIAITMLFKPLKKRPLLGQGLIPAHKERIAYRLSLAISEDLINPEIIKTKISESNAISRYREQTIQNIMDVTSKPAFRNDLKDWVINYIRDAFNDPAFKNSLASQVTEEIENSLDDKIVEKAALKTYSFLKGRPLQVIVEDALENLPASIERRIDFIEDFLNELPERIEQNSKDLDELLSTIIYRLVNQLDVQKLVEEKLEKYDEKKLELMIRNATNEQLRTIQYLGAILGTIGGFVIWEPVLSLSVLGVIFGTVYLVDRQLFA